MVLVEHHPFGALPPGRVGCFRPPGRSLFDHPSQDLGRPDDRHVGRLATPGNVLLDFADASEAKFDSQIEGASYCLI
ncbi:hypothetical protein CWS35_08110 [Bradyrhizobium sp. SK17]|nr:hypothetical protein CWS35_08110 [Bradyrhizobium sp. SK17]KKC25946.1 hypothetical protein WP12_11455 [Sphingomonas sp. SRS2]